MPSELFPLPPPIEAWTDAEWRVLSDLHMEIAAERLAAYTAAMQNVQQREAVTFLFWFGNQLRKA